MCRACVCFRSGRCQHHADQSLGVEPPESEYAKGENLVPTLPQWKLGFPKIPGVNYTGWYNDVSVKDTSTLPNTPIPGKFYEVLVARTDRDGNDIPGVRHPELQVPIGTHTGWALRRAPFAENEDCALTGQFIPFATTKAERAGSGDPRKSLEERYRDHAEYVKKITHAVRKSVKVRHLLEEDGEAIISKAQSSEVAQKFSY